MQLLDFTVHAGARDPSTQLMARLFAKAAVTAMPAMLLFACGGGGSSAPMSAPMTTYTVGGVVTRLSGSGLVLQNNAGTGLAVSASGPFTFMGGLGSGAAYSVIVAAQPSSPAQNCVVANGSGTVGTANVTNVAVACKTVPFTTLINQPPEPGYLALLLTDGSCSSAAHITRTNTACRSRQAGSPTCPRSMTPLLIGGR